MVGSLRSDRWSAARIDSANYITNSYQLIWYSAMPRKEQGWITFQSSDEERRILEQICQQTQRTKTEILREMIRQMGQSVSSEPTDVDSIEFSEDLEAEVEGNGSTATLQAVQISARNILRAKVKRVVKGAVNAEVTLVIAPNVELVSIVTRTSADKLGLKKGKEVYAVIKSSSVMIAAGQS
jgi:molybdopterin-binding protein